MAQAQEAVDRIKAPEGESQPMTEVDLFISTKRIKVLSADTQIAQKYDAQKEEELRVWIEDVTGKRIGDDFQKSLKSGTILCE
ncbi:UNVERIFIED_CONTAM: hypothetical protein FKN15_008672 [Acipenser sinensis]